MARKPKVTITRVYLVDCDQCGAVNLALGDAETPAQARALKAEHLAAHERIEKEGAHPTPAFNHQEDE